MLVSPCAELKSLSTLLREKYDVRNKTLSCVHPDSSLLQAELEIIRVQKLITSHRRRCSQCKQNEISSFGADGRLRPLARDGSFTPIQTH